MTTNKSEKVSPIPEGMATVTPHLVCGRCADAIEFYKEAFGAVEVARMSMPNSDKVMHAMIGIGNSMVMLVDEFPQWGSVGPITLKGSPVTLHLYVDDVDALVDRAVKAGAEVTMPVMDAFWGDRYGKIEDPFGHQWSIATHVSDLTPEEMQKAAQEFFNSMREGKEGK